MQTAAALGDAPAPIGSTSLDPYGQLIRMLMPRAHSIAIYDRMGVPVWLSEGQDVPELHRLIQDALTGELSEEEQRDGFAEVTDRDQATYVFMMRDASGGYGAWPGCACGPSLSPG